MIKSLSLAGALVAGGLAFAAPASATPAGFGLAGAADALVTQVADGCGPGWHRNRWGHCRPHGGGYGHRQHHHGHHHHGHRRHHW